MYRLGTLAIHPFRVMILSNVKVYIGGLDIYQHWLWEDKLRKLCVYASTGKTPRELFLASFPGLYKDNI